MAKDNACFSVVSQSTPAQKLTPIACEVSMFSKKIHSVHVEILISLVVEFSNCVGLA